MFLNVTLLVLAVPPARALEFSVGVSAGITVPELGEYKSSSCEEISDGKNQYFVSSYTSSNV